MKRPPWPEEIKASRPAFHTSTSTLSLQLQKQTSRLQLDLVTEDEEEEGRTKIIECHHQADRVAAFRRRI